MSESFVYDPSNERQHYALAGLQHKYRETVLLFVSRDCHSTCKWCFRKRLFDGQDLEDDQIVDPIAALDYLRTHKEVRSVLLSGGDAALADPDLLRELFEGIAGIDHIHNVRIGTRALVHDPFAYVDCIPTTYSRKIFVVLHIVRPEEVSSALREVVIAYQNHAFFVQIPLLRGINNDPQVMSDLWHKCSLNGLSPYYVFQCRPAIGNERFALTLREGHEVFSGAQACTTGVVKTPRYVMSNRTGKWEILGLDHDEIVLRCHQGTHPEMVGAIRHASPHAVWWDLRHDDPLIDATPMHRRTISGEE